MRAVIISGGSITNYNVIRGYIKPDDFIICADSGYDHANEMHIRPHLVVGDMDSIKSDIKAEQVERFPAKKDLTDTEIAAQAAIERGCKELIFLGVTGSRMDHTISNILLLKRLHEQDVSAVIADEHNEIIITSSRIVLQGKPGDIVSLVPIVDCQEVTTYNLEYPLKNEALLLGSARGVSNLMLGNKAEIEIKQGILLVMRCRD